MYKFVYLEDGSACHLSLSSAHTSGSIQVWDTSLYFITWLFYGEELFAPHPTPKLEYYPLLSDCNCVFNIIAATLHIGGRSSIRNLRTLHAVVTGTHLSWPYCILWWIYYNKWFIRCIVSMYNKHYWILSFLICFIPRIIRKGHISCPALPIANYVF